MLPFLIAVFTSGKTVGGVGTGACAIGVIREQFDYYECLCTLAPVDQLAKRWRWVCFFSPSLEMENIMLRRTFIACLGYAAASLAISIAGPAVAGEQSGVITILSAQNKGWPAAVVVNGTRTNKPACATDGAWTFKDANLFAMLLSAYFNAKPVSITGTGACSTEFPNREEVNYINLP